MTIHRALTSLLIASALAFMPAIGQAEQKTIRIDFEAELYSGGMLDYSRPGAPYVGPVYETGWDKAGFLLLSFDDTPYATPISTNEPQWPNDLAFAHATSAELFLGGVQRMNPSTSTTMGLAAWHESSGAGADYDIVVELDNRWVDATGSQRHDFLQFSLDGFSYDTPTIHSDFELALYAAESIHNSHTIKSQFDTVTTEGQHTANSYLSLVVVTAVSAVPEPQNAAMAAMGLMAICWVVRRRKAHNNAST